MLCGAISQQKKKTWNDDEVLSLESCSWGYKRHFRETKKDCLSKVVATFFDEPSTIQLNKHLAVTKKHKKERNNIFILIPFS